MADSLRTYQKQGIKDIFEKWRAGKRSILFQMPTGTGKTVLLAEIVSLGFSKNKKILIVVHRKELVEQIKKKLNEKGVETGIIMAGENQDYSKIVQVASIQTLSRRQHPEANLIIIDECHHAKAATYKKLWTIYPEAKFLGVTATPIRLNGEGFDDLFDELIVTMPVRKFIDMGFLVPITHYVCANPNLSNIKIRQGDYETKMLSNIMMDNSVMSDIVQSYCDKCNGKSAIVFAVDVDHSIEIASRFMKAGIDAAHIDSKTPEIDRKRILDEFKSKKIKVVSNVEIITEGFDFPECEAVILARPTKSLSLYLQMVGRVMRTAINKTEGIVLDNASLWLEHGLAIIDRQWELKGVSKKKKNFNKIQVVALDNNDILTKIERYRLQEIKGLKLILITLEIERLLKFENFLSLANLKQYNLLYAYNEYLKYLEEDKIKLTQLEFEYIQNRLNYINKKRPIEKQFKRGTWYHESKKHGLKEPKYEK